MALNSVGGEVRLGWQGASDREGSVTFGKMVRSRSFSDKKFNFRKCAICGFLANDGIP